MTAWTRFTVDEASVVHEVIDGEAVIVDLARGTYYSAEGAGGEIWRMASAGTPLAAVVDSLVRRYEAERKSLESAVCAFLDELVAEGLLHPCENHSGLAAAGDHAAPDDAAVRLPFTAPRLRKYTDMTEMLALDPIHDVSRRR